MDDPALEVMTDFKKVTAITISSWESIETANQRMIQKGIRTFFVVDAHDYLVGLITASDILGETLIQYIQSFGGQRKDITVEDIMVSRENTVRGIFSLTQIARQLGIDIQIHELDHTFAEIAQMARM